MNYSQVKWDRFIIEEWLQIATFVDRALPAVYRKGISGQRYDIQRTWIELLWDTEEINKRTLRWEPTSEQISMWEEVILRWLPLLKNPGDRKIVWLRSSGASWPKIAKVANLSRQYTAKHYERAIEELLRKVPNLYTKIS